MNKTVFTIILLILSIINTFAQTGKIQGRIYDEKNNEPLPFANIVIYGTNIGSTSDLDGKFIFTGVNPGFIRLAVSSVGYKMVITEEIQVSSAKTSVIDIPMQQTVIETEEIKIEATPFKIKKESPVSLRTLSISEIEKSPGGNRDISKVIQSFPGVASTPANRNDLIVRGGGSSENRFYLDGIEIPNINHFATQGASGGATGIINVDFIREVDLYTGAFPAVYGNAMSSVLDMKQIDGNSEKLSFKGSVGATDLALTANGPLSDNTTFIASVRRSYLQFLFDAIGLPFLPTYNDYQLKVKSKISNKTEVTILSLGALDVSTLNTGLKNPNEFQRYILGYLPVNKQWSYTIGANFKHFREKSFENFIISRNMLNNVSYKYFNNDESKAENLLLNYKSQEMENKFRYENTSSLKSYKIKFGAGIEFARYNNETTRKVFAFDSLLTLKYYSAFDLFKWNVFGQITNSYLDERLSLSLGVRMDANSFTPQMSNLLNQFSPRFSASYVLTDKISLNFNTGRYFQPPAYTTMGYRNNNNVLVNKENGLKYIRSDHLVAGFEFRPSKTARMTVEGFYKLYSNYPFSVTDSISIASKGGDFGTFGDEEVVPTGKGRAYGFEVLMQEKEWKGINFILSYTFVRSEFLNGDGKYISSAWDNKHLLNITARKTFGKGWDVGFKWRFVGGTPYTPYDLEKSSLIAAWDASGRGYLDYSRFNSLRFKPFHQLDIRIDKSFFFKKWSLTLYTDVQNVYNFQSETQEFLLNTDENGNILYDPNDPNRYQLRSIKSFSGTVLPSIGIIVEF
ncbi:MAG TPA: TonB-dependent receptor [Bacteroidia bacterium]|nr:TonB-dependent receptor [Bacteroidia bacterium]HRU67339.1 TonB-dependent receptor [Bacteroidia bacterium]